MSDPLTYNLVSGIRVPKKILVPIDGSENSKRALEVAIELAKMYDSVLIVLTVIPLPTAVRVANTSRYMAVDSYYESRERDANPFMDAAFQTAKVQGISKVRRELLRAPKSTVEGIIVAASRNKIDLIVIGTRGLGGFKKLLLGSVSSGVVTHAPCNVLVVR